MACSIFHHATNKRYVRICEQILQNQSKLHIKQIKLTPPVDRLLVLTLSITLTGFKRHLFWVIWRS